MGTVDWCVSAVLVALVLALVKWLLGRIITSEYDSYTRARDEASNPPRPPAGNDEKL